MRLDIFRRGEARGAEDRLGDAEVVPLRLGVVERIDFRLPVDLVTVGDVRLGAFLSADTGSA